MRPTVPANAVDPYENVRDAAVNLPPGFVGNPAAVVGGCTVDEVQKKVCPDRFAVGRVGPYIDFSTESPFLDRKAVVYKVTAEKGYAAEFAFRAEPVSALTVTLRAKVRPGDGTVTAFAPRPTQNPALLGVKYFTFCSFGAQVEHPAGFPSFAWL